MRKLITILTILTFVGFSFAAKAQLIALNTSSTVTGDPSTTLAAHIAIVNTGSGPVVVKVIRSIITNASGHDISFCWGSQCYLPSISVSPIQVTILPGDTNTSFVGDVAPNGINGTDIVSYTFQDTSNANNKVSKEFTYDFVTGINNLNPPSGNYLFGSQSNAGEAIIKYNITNPAHAELIITNLLGSVIKEIFLTDQQGVVTIAVSDMPAGIYIYSLYNSGEVIAAKKTMITHR